jgi:putative DNA-invertase from lambdoid prophage Rac
MRVFGYGRVSTADQTTENQRQELEALGHTIQSQRWFSETISGKVQTIRGLTSQGVKVKVLALGDVDLTSTAGKAVLGILATVAEMERDLLVERTQAGLARAKAEGKQLGRPSKTSEEDKATIRTQLHNGVTVSQVARDFGISRASVISIREGAQA